MNFLVNCTKKPGVNFIRILLNLQIILGSVFNLTVVSSDPWITLEFL